MRDVIVGHRDLSEIRVDAMFPGRGTPRMRRLVEHRRNFGPKAPITEALIDMQVINPDDLDLQSLKDFASRFPDRFPTARLQTQFESQFRVQGGEAASVGFQHGLRGFSFFSPNQDRVVQARRDGFTFSKLHPYESWEKLCDEAKELWGHYREVAHPSLVKRLAVRYINRIPLPSDPVRLPDWFNLHPTTPDPLGPMEEFLVRTVWSHPDDSSYRAVATQVTQSDVDGNPTVVLDIDVFTVTEGSFEENDIWKILDDLHEYKNDVFFGTITKVTEESLL
ncbi:MAG: TIGR04255 family protein [Myxococcota bacterium]